MLKLLLKITLVLIFPSTNLFSQNIYSDKQFQFISFETIPTWAGVASNWQNTSPTINLYDITKYQGHADYVSVALKTGITFKQFKEQIKNFNTRKYIPFFIYDLRNNPISIEGKKYTWALKIQDYGFEDNPEQMTETTLKMLNTLSDFISNQSTDYSKGLIVLVTNTAIHPNTNIAPAINKAGYPNLTQSQLLSRVGGKKVKVLNAGTGIGYLRYVKAGEENKISASITDILIYESLPKKVPPVNGIITIEPQTPLSHVNLLAKNRGTINLYTTDLSYLPEAKALLNKLVKIVCTDEKITISETTLKEAEKFWASKALKIEIPQPKLSDVRLINLTTINPSVQTTEYIGAKASNYAFIRQAFPKYVQAAFAIPFTHYFNSLKNCGADTLIFKITKQKLQADELTTQLELIRKRILNSSVDREMITELKVVIGNHFHNSKIRLRSSTNCEDLPGFNGAGLYLSTGYNIKKDSSNTLEKKILEIYASLWTTNAFEERAFYFIDHSKAAMAILINEAFSNEYANGVVLTIPEKNDYAIYINTQYGSDAVTNPENGQVPEALLYKMSAYTNFEVETKSNIHNIFLQDNLRPTLQELKKVTMDIHQKLTQNTSKGETEYGVDIEFKIIRIGEEYKLFVKQARLLGKVVPE